jgi:hypothetical protein
MSFKEGKLTVCNFKKPFPSGHQLSALALTAYYFAMGQRGLGKDRICPLGSSKYFYMARH